ncbi:S-layer homology domain-containing protein [Phosphitispora sp. TUW77]|uniref:S-layer homology domain-containing protein n=1 Tax=Phosphitispora sp. TUW77 TaxID=3152361 RepID=UPI003AB564D5
MKKSKSLLAKLLLSIMLFSFVLPGSALLAATSPTITVSTPEDDAVVTTNSIVVSGYVTNTIILRINGVGVSFGSSGFFSYTVRNLSEGNNSIKISATSSSGSATSKYLSVSYDPDAIKPIIEISSHDDNEQVYMVEQNISGTLTEADSLDITLNGVTEIFPVLDENGGFTAEVTLVPGDNVIVFTAGNSGLMVTETLHLTYTASSLILSLTVNDIDVNDYITTTTGSVTLEGSAPDADSVDIVLNEDNNTSNFNGISFSADLSLERGANRVAVLAEGTGVTETREIIIYYGDEGPQVYDVSPENASTVYTTSITVEGMVRDAAFISVNGYSTSIASDGTFSRSVTLAANEWNVITIMATSADGIVTTHTFNLYCETDPVIFLDEPDDGDVFYTNTLTVSGEVVNTKYSGLTVNGTVVSFNSSGSFSTTLLLKPGYNSINIKAQNSAGVQVEENVTVEYRGGPCIVNISPDSEVTHTVNSSSVTITGKIVNVATGGLKINNSVVSFDSSGYFKKTLTLAAGLNEISITATDGYSTVEDTLNIRYESGPVILITSPDNEDIVVRDTITIEGKVLNTEKNGLTINDEIESFSTSDGSFSADVELTELENEIIINAYNGETAAVKTLNIYYSGIPGITVSSHSNGDVVDTADIIIEGTVFPVDSSEINTFTVNGVDTLDRITDGKFRSQPITLEAGDNEIELSLTTASILTQQGYTIPSRTISRMISLTYSDGPSIVVDSPLEGATVYSNMVTVKGKLKKADFNTLEIDGEETGVSSDGSFSRIVALEAGENEIELSASFGEATTTKILTVYYNTIAQEGSEVRTGVEDGDEIKAFDDWIKIKLDTGSVGLNTESLLMVEDPDDLEDAPGQSAFVGPLFYLRWLGDDPVKSYKVTLKYDDVVGERQSHKVTVLFYDTEEDEWQVLGGIVSPKSKTVSIETASEGYFAAAVYFRTFDDVNYHWAQRDIEFLTARGAIAGKTGNTFKPNDSVTRAEFVTFLVRILGLREYSPEDASYSDVSRKHWAFPYIEAALRAGIVSGVSHNKFAPDRKISREEAAVLLARAGNLKTPKEQEITKIFSDFTDAERISQWAYEDVAAAIKIKLMKGFVDGTFSPSQNTTRAQAAAMMSRLYEVVNKTSR